MEINRHQRKNWISNTNIKTQKNSDLGNIEVRSGVHLPQNVISLRLIRGGGVVIGQMSLKFDKFLEQHQYQLRNWIEKNEMNEMRLKWKKIEMKLKWNEIEQSGIFQTWKKIIMKEKK